MWVHDENVVAMGFAAFDKLGQCWWVCPMTLAMRKRFCNNVVIKSGQRIAPLLFGKSQELIAFVEAFPNVAIHSSKT